MAHPAPDRGRLDRYLRAHLGVGVAAIEALRGGQSNPTFLLHAEDGGRLVLRCKPAPAAELLPSAHAVEREYRVISALAGSGVPVPRAQLLCEDEAVIGVAFYVMEHVAGRVLRDPSLPQQQAAERGALYRAMNHTLATLHGVDPSSVGLADYGPPGNYIERQVSRWTRQYRASESGRIEAMERLIEWLPQRIPPQDATCIVHGDYRIDNLVFAHARPEVAAVLDWELSTLGHPLADFAYHCLAWFTPPGALRGIAGLDLADLGIPSLDSYIGWYCEATGRDGIPDLPYFLAYNLFRLAAIAQGIARRAATGTAADARARETGALAGPVAELGWRIAAGGLDAA